MDRMLSAREITLEPVASMRQRAAPDTIVQTPFIRAKASAAIGLNGARAPFRGAANARVPTRRVPR